jgi:elongation factor G
MANITTADLRNVAVVGHGDTGKTTLVSACLYVSGAVNRMGLVDQGTSVTDYDAEEIERQISIQAALAHCDWKGAQITFIDTPGYSVFRPDTMASVRVADSVAITVDAVSGPQVMTDTTWGYARDYDAPVVFVVNRLDRENASFQRTFDALFERYGREVVALQIPLGREHDFEGVIDLITMKAYRYDKDGNGKGKEEEIPEEHKARAEAQHEALVEMVAEGKEDLLEAFFEEGTLSPEQLAEGILEEVSHRKLFPVMCISALHNIGTDRVLDAFVNFLPAPSQHGKFTGKDPSDGSEISRAVDPDAPFAALVFKTVADPYAGHISLMKAFSGSAEADAPVLNPRTGDIEKLHNLHLAQGKDHEPLDRIVAGQICAVAKLKDVQTGDTLCDKSSPILIDHVDYPKAAISFAVEPESRGDEEKISTALARLKGEDPTLDISRDSQTHEMLISGLGQLHVEVTVAKLEKRFGVHCTLKPPKVPYRATLRRSAQAEGKHKKQTGGRGQFGVCVIEIGPNERGAGFEFIDEIFGGSIPQQFRPAVEKGIIEAAERGVLAGFPLVDFKVRLLDGKFHSVDSSEIAFKIAGSLAFREASARADPVLLEPVMDVEITIPDETMGDVMGDLNSRRGRVQGMDPSGDQQIIRAQVPLAEVLSYAPDLNSLTGGRGTYTMEFSHYDEVPAHVSQKVIADAEAAREEENK